MRAINEAMDSLVFMNADSPESARMFIRLLLRRFDKLALLFLLATFARSRRVAARLAGLAAVLASSERRAMASCSAEPLDQLTPRVPTGPPVSSVTESVYHFGEASLLS
jgi:hypothetical protein